MNPPARSLRTELNDALIGGIRLRGPEAFGWMLVALIRIAITVIVLVLMLMASWAGGYEVTAWPFFGMTTISGLVSWLLTRGRDQEDGDDREGKGKREAPDGPDPG